MLSTSFLPLHGCITATDSVLQKMLEVGTKAPDFELPDQNGELHKLSEYLGKKVILYFYPRDNTPGCTKQACGFSDRYPQFVEKGAVVLGVSNLRKNMDWHLRFYQIQSARLLNHMMYGRKRKTTEKYPWVWSEQHTLLMNMG